MQMDRLILVVVLTFSLLVGCATTNLPPITGNDPANPNASEGVTPPARSALGIDDATQRTNQLIAVRAKQDAEQTPQEKSKEAAPGMENMPGI